ncbi:MAG: ABC transporter ATP-binding protein [Actinobacteria bacterium]|nr:ABC transporter ATP-binding protein [Actinomycetota bacterium]
MVDITLDGVSVGFEGEGDTRVALALDDLTLHVASGELLALVGPSGSGKSTVLRTIAGLQRADRGVVRIDGEMVNDHSPGERDVAMVAQSTTLLSHLTVEDNLGFALRLRDLPPDETSARVRAEARVLGLWSRLRRRPRHLSSGERRKTALGRATSRTPRAFLFDEPLAGLDAGERDRVRRALRQQQRGMKITTIYVTHDQRDAMALADRVAVMDRGRIVQVGSPLEVYTEPVNLFVAQFFSTPPLGTLEGRLNDDGTTAWVDIDGTALRLHRSQRQAVRRHGAPERIVVGLRSSAVRADAGAASEEWARRLPMVVVDVQPLGPTTTVVLRPRGAGRGGPRLYAAVPPTTRVGAGDAVTAHLDLRAAFVFDGQTRARIASSGN